MLDCYCIFDPQAGSPLIIVFTHVKTILATGKPVDLAEWIINDTCLVMNVAICHTTSMKPLGITLKNFLAARWAIKICTQSFCNNLCCSFCLCDFSMTSTFWTFLTCILIHSACSSHYICTMLSVRLLQLFKND